MNNKEYIEHFLALSYLHFQLTGTHSENASYEEMAELWEALNDSNEPGLCPDQHVA